MALVVFIIEIFTTGFAVICFSIGAVGAALVSLLDASFNMQLLSFAVVSMLSLCFMRPLLLKLFGKRYKSVNTNADAIIGRQVLVCDDIDPITGGYVKFDGEVWTARSLNGSYIPSGKVVTVIRIEGIILIVQ